MICKENDVVSIFNLLFVNAVPPRQIQVCLTLVTLSLLSFQKSVFAALTLYIPRILPATSTDLSLISIPM